MPQRAVSATPQGQSVMVVDAEGKVAPRPIVTGGMAGGDFIVDKGLQAGDQVIVNGLQKARPGATVKPVPWNPAGGQSAVPPGLTSAPGDKAAAEKPLDANSAAAKPAATPAAGK